MSTMVNTILLLLFFVISLISIPFSYAAIDPESGFETIPIPPECETGFSVVGGHYGMCVSDEVIDNVEICREMTRNDQFEQAISCYNKHDHQIPKYGFFYIDVLYNLGNSHYGIGNLQESLYYYKQLLTRDSTDVFTLANICNVYNDLGNLKQATYFSKKALDIDNEFFPAYTCQLQTRDLLLESSEIFSPKLQTYLLISPPEEIKCKKDLKLIFKYDGSAICVTSTTAQILETRNSGFDTQNLIMEFSADYYSFDDKYMIIVTDPDANIHQDESDVISIEISDGGPVQAGTTSTIHIIVTETDADTGVFSRSGLVSDVTQSSGILRATYQTDDKIINAVTRLVEFADNWVGPYGNIDISFDSDSYSSNNSMRLTVRDDGANLSSEKIDELSVFFIPDFNPNGYSDGIAVSLMENSFDSGVFEKTIPVSDVTDNVGELLVVYSTSIDYTIDDYQFEVLFDCGCYDTSSVNITAATNELKQNDAQ